MIQKAVANTWAVFALSLLLCAPASLMAAGVQRNEISLASSSARDTRNVEALKQEVRHQLVTLPYYSVFDWLEAQVMPDGTVTLMGQVTQPMVKSDAESRIEKLEGATRVVNNIDVLPLSATDDQIRREVYRSVYKTESPLFKYALQAVGPIHILVKNGHVTLKGMVDTPEDKQLAYMAANSVPGVFSVQNELEVEKNNL